MLIFLASNIGISKNGEAIIMNFEKSIILTMDSNKKAPSRYEITDSVITTKFDVYEVG